MNILVAPDSFKGCMSAEKVCAIMEQGIHDVDPAIHVKKIPMADGGEGSINCVLHALHGEKRYVQVQNPCGKTISAYYGYMKDTHTAIIEMAIANGLTLLNNTNRNPLYYNTYGTGQLIRDALDIGCTTILLCLGGSATNDGGAGMADALGIRFLDRDGNIVAPYPDNFRHMKTIDDTQLHPRIKDCNFHVLSDVQNPLCGPTGASYMFGKQKGADDAMIQQLDHALCHYADIVEEYTQSRYRNQIGAGAAGGLAFGIYAFLHGSYQSGIRYMMDLIHLKEEMKGMDFILTGEGCTDAQSAYGKTCAGIAQIAKDMHIPLICVSGGIHGDLHGLYELGMSAIFSTTSLPCTLENAISHGEENLKKTITNIIKLLKIQYDKK